MNDREREMLNESDFESLLYDSVSDMPPEEVVSGVTPWKRAMNYFLIGLALTTITLNFLCLNYILPAVGMVMIFLGLRVLRHENSWFRWCFIAAIIKSLCFFPNLILNTTIYNAQFYETDFAMILTGINISLTVIMFICLFGGLKEVQTKAGLEPHAGGAAALIVWYIILCLLAFIEYVGYVTIIAMLVLYIFIIKNLYDLSSELDEAGYAIEVHPPKLSDNVIIIIISSVMAVGVALGYIFGGSYEMDWRRKPDNDGEDIIEVKERLLSLGFPEDVLDDMTREDIFECMTATNVIVTVNDHPVNEGREESTYREPDPENGEDGGIYITTVYDEKELRLTQIAVKLENGYGAYEYKIIQHFRWVIDPGFYGTESIQLWPAYRMDDAWACTDEVSGRVLYDKNGETYISPYEFLGRKTYTTNGILLGERTSTDIFATFSMPSHGEGHRGYLTYTVQSLGGHALIDGWINYTHQTSWLQYPAKTAMETRMTNTWRTVGAFLTVQDAIQFYPYSEDEK